LISRRTIHAGRKGRFEIWTTEGRDGPVEREVLVHPGSVAIVPVLDDGRIVLIENERPTVGERLIEVCAGTREGDESFEQCAHRELEEETGYRAAELEELASFYLAPGVSTEHMHVFVARGLQHVGQSLEPDENITVRIASESQIAALLRDRTIRDAKTIAALSLHFHR
jgi:ADP-ribose pyrophosphatase